MALATSGCKKIENSCEDPHLNIVWGCYSSANKGTFCKLVSELDQGSHLLPILTDCKLRVLVHLLLHLASIILR